MNIRQHVKNRAVRLAVFPFLPIALLSGALALSGCSKKNSAQRGIAAVPDTSDVYAMIVTKARKTKDLSFLRDDSSPLLAEQREQFDGLKYYAPDKSFAFETVLHRLPAPEAMVMATSKDKPREMLRIGWLPFVHGGKEYRLQVYMPKDTSEEKYWFIPFTDETSGGETYGSGRFIDIDKPASDSTFLDFNYAYNPYCAYNHRYDCPIPPKENRLPIAITAGEKVFLSEPH